LEAAQAALEDLRVAARKGLEAACASRDLRQLRDAVVEGESVCLEADELDRALGLLVEAERREAALSSLQAGAKSGAAEVLSAAIKEAEEAGIAAGDMESAREALAQLARTAGAAEPREAKESIGEASPQDGAADRGSKEVSRLHEEVLAATCSHDTAGVRRVVKELDAAGVSSAQVCNLTDSDGNVLLHLAVRELPQDESWSDVSAVVHFLVELQCDVNARNACDETPLVLASRAASAFAVDPTTQNGNANDGVQIVQALIEAGADPNAGDDQGETSLMEAACVGNMELCRVLLHGRADPWQTSSFGLTAVDVSRDNPEVLTFLSKTTKASSPDVRCN